MNIHPIASSSEGNCTLVSTNNTNILIDVGITLKELKANGVSNVNGIFVSHEHSDHWKGAGPASRLFGCPLYMNQASYDMKKNAIGSCNFINVNPGDTIQINELSVTHFSTKHDVKMSFGYLIKEENGITFCYVTDTGMITGLIAEKIKEADVLMIEADYDEDLLRDYAGYEQWLKDRISSNFGHLSNQQTIEFLSGVYKDLDKVIFAHLSHRTNTPEMIIKMAHDKLENSDRFLTAPLNKPLEFLHST